jgi:hypothetical protein
MNRHHSSLWQLAALCFILPPSSFILAQGPLTPPGAPTATMKTLDQVEARTPISSAPFTINQSGSYYLTGNLTVSSGTAITIAADQVTLDLNGFSISSTASPASGSGVHVSGLRRNVTVRNGHIRGATTLTGLVFNPGGFTSGFTTSGGGIVIQRVEDVNVEGVAGDAILMPAAAMYSIERCRVNVAGGIGMRAGSVADSHVNAVGQVGIWADMVTNCTATSMGQLSGHSGIIGTKLVENSNGTGDAGMGIQGQGAVNNSQGQSVTNVGLLAATVTNSSGSSSTGTGLQADISAQNCRGSSGAGTGLQTPIAQGCTGISSATGSAGISCTIASFCRGQRDGGAAILAVNAIGCSVLGTGLVSAANKSLGTP